MKKTVRWADDVADGGDSSAARGLTVSPATAAVDLWSQLDPHDNSSLVPRPFRRGVTTRKPHVPHLSSSGSLSHDFTLHMQLAMQQANPAQAILLRAIANNQIQVEHERAHTRSYLPTSGRKGHPLDRSRVSLSVLTFFFFFLLSPCSQAPFFAEFSSLYVREQERRKRKRCAAPHRNDRAAQRAQCVWAASTAVLVLIHGGSMG